MNDNRPLKDEALIQMQYLEGEIRSHKEMDQALRDLAKSDGYDARRIMLTDEEMQAFINGQKRWEAMVSRFKDDVSPCEQNEPDEIVIPYEQEQPQALRKAAWFVVGVLVVLVLAILAG